MRTRYMLILFFVVAISFSQTTMDYTPRQTTGCVSGNCNDGWGEYQYDNGNYIGFWSNGKKSGYGVYDWTTSGKYVGFWEVDQMSGYGIYHYNVKDELSGEFYNGKLHGFGSTFIDGKWTHGMYRNGDLKVEYAFNDNNKSAGCIAGDCQNKYGRFKWATGDIFTGFFQNGFMYMGSYTFANGNVFNGMLNDKSFFDGDGRFFFNNGDYYGGKFKDGKYHGRGYYLYHDKKADKGVWTDGKLTTSY